ncbi:glycosyltransferase family 39 protein [Chondromyces apiculatus]|uniref:Uncharacterized protein n=1 Tax=Chondromyces apiculatus DSM 436 TaxID=1192034 RepID=A0A017SX28_9BACT|nr:glycosyltransferase family 39 protein [Chondromyces apiculatus]EYF00886.1 Hypothetical protein CAP_8903 [Chondromyces apiculatus DSM 436]
MLTPPLSAAQGTASPPSTDITVDVPASSSARLRAPRTTEAKRDAGHATETQPHVPGGKALVTCALALSAASLLLVLTFGYGRDQGIYAMVARTTLEGGMPYRDAFDFKPPGIFLIFMLSRALFGPAQWGVRVLEVAGLIAMGACMVKLAERWWGDRRIGIVAAALTMLVHAQLDFWHTAQPESFGGMLTIVALLLTTPPPAFAEAPRALAGEGSSRAPLPAFRLLGAGLLFGFAGLLKPPLAGGGAVLAAALGWPALQDLAAQRRARTPLGARQIIASLAAALRPAALIALGGAAPIAACLAWFAARGALADLHRVLFVFTPYYTALGWKDKSALGLSWYGVMEWLTNYSGPMTLGLACLVALHPERRERSGVALAGGIVAMHLAGVVMQAKFFPYHYGATWPLTGMLAALGLWKAWAAVARRGRALAAVFLVALLGVGFARSATKDVAEGALKRTARRVALMAGGMRDQAGLDALASVADVNAEANRAASAFLNERVTPERAVFVWGFEPVIYDLSGRASASRYLYNVPQRASWGREEAREALLRDLAARPPAAIVVERHDVFPMVTGDVIDSRDTLERFPAMADLLDERYRLAATFEDLDVYLEDDAP